MLWLRSIRRRPGAALSVWLVAVLTTAVAAAGPMLLHSVGESALRQAVADAPAGAADVVVSASTEPGQLRSVSVVASEVEGAAGPATLTGPFGPPVVTVRSADVVVFRSDGAASGSTVERARLVARDDGCSGFVVVAGRCPTGASDVLAPVGEVTAGRVRLGGSVVVDPPGPGAVRYAVVGAYDPTRSAASRPAVGDPSPGLGNGGAPVLVFSVVGLGRVPMELSVSARSMVVAARLRLDQEPAVRASVAAVRQAALAQSVPLAFSSGLPALLDRVDADRRAVGGLISVVTVQAVALAWFSALVVMRLVARVRGREWALGRLRGVRRRSWLAAVFGEPAVLLVTGAVVGLLVGVLACRLATARWLPAGGRVDPWRAPVLALVGPAVPGLAAGLAVASLRSARAPLAVLLREGADQPRVSRSVAVAEALVVAATAAAVYQLSVGGTLSGSSAGLALLAPGLVATAVGLMAVRLVVGVVRRRTRRPVRTVGGLIVWRQLARSPSGLQRNIVVAIAVALAVFATQLGALSERNQGLRADAEVGAGTVLRVRVPVDGDLLQLVRSADPAGTSAMAVAERDASSDGGTSRVVAVDTERLARISPWRASWAGLSTAKLIALLRPPAPAPILLRGRQVRLDLVDVGFTAEVGLNGPSSAVPAPSLHLIVADAARWYDIPLGTLRAGRHTLSAPIPCLRQCRVVRLQTQNDGQPTPYTAGFTVSGVSTDQQPVADFAAGLRRAGSWRAGLTSIPIGGQDRVDVIAEDDGLRIAVTDKTGTAAPAVAPADTPDPLPALLGRRVDSSQVAGCRAPWKVPASTTSANSCRSSVPRLWCRARWTTESWSTSATPVLWPTPR